MITEQELELALSLRDKIKELKVIIAKFENVIISESGNLGHGVSMDNTRIIADDYTKSLLIKFKEEVIDVHRVKLLDLKAKYKEIIESPNDTLRRILEENG